jgi:DNA adenine methylase
MSALKAPFPWFGGKSRAAPLIWERFGDVNNYVEPFAGSLAVMLARQTPPRSETVNDIDCYLANFWRALAADPMAVARWADAPVNEADLHARHLWLVGKSEFRERMKTDPDFFDVRIAGWWVWGLSCWIGGGWCALRETGPWKQRPDLRPGLRRGVLAIERKRPAMHGRKFGNRVHQSATRRQIPRIDAMCDTGANNTEELGAWFESLAARLRRVRVACGDWSRVLGPTPLGLTSNVPNGFRTGVVLDPPYDLDLRDSGLYANDGAPNLSKAVREWALEHGSQAKLRIALCGYEGEHDMPDDWECVAWKANGGYGNRTGNDNAHKERIWFSPHCLKPEQGQKEFTL